MQASQFKSGMFGKATEIRRLTLSDDKKMLLVNDQNMTKVLERYSLDNNGMSLARTTNLPRAKDGSIVEKCDGMVVSRGVISRLFVLRPPQRFVIPRLPPSLPLHP